jgi:hypothetical protein
MPIKIKTDLEFGSTWFLKSDPEQLPHLLVGIIIKPGNIFKFQLSYMGDVCAVYDFEATDEPDREKLLNLDKDEEN